MCNVRSNIIIVATTKSEQMSLKFGKAIRARRLSQIQLVLMNVKSAIDIPAQTLFDSYQQRF